MRVEEPNYYSVAFLYKHAVRGVSSGGIHLSFYVDERKESDRLSKAMNFVCGVLDELNIDSRHEYCWPDGSLIRFVRTNYGIIELSMLLEARLKGMKFEVVPVSALCEAQYGTGETLEQFFRESLSDKAHRKKDLMKFVARAVIVANP